MERTNFSAKSLPSFLSFKKKKLKEQPDCSQNENQALSLRRGKTWSNVGSSEEPFSFLCSRVGKSKSLFYIKLIPLPFQGITKQLKKRGSMATPGQRGGQNGTAPSLKEVAPKGSSFGATSWSREHVQSSVEKPRTSQNRGRIFQGKRTCFFAAI